MRERAECRRSLGDGRSHPPSEGLIKCVRRAWKVIISNGMRKQTLALITSTVTWNSQVKNRLPDGGKTRITEVCNLVYLSYPLLPLFKLCIICANDMRLEDPAPSC